PQRIVRQLAMIAHGLAQFEKVGIAGGPAAETRKPLQLDATLAFGQRQRDAPGERYMAGAVLRQQFVGGGNRLNGIQIEIAVAFTQKEREQSNVRAGIDHAVAFPQLDAMLQVNAFLVDGPMPEAQLA